MVGRNVARAAIASEIVEECFQESYEIVNKRYFDRLAIPYAVQWASSIARCLAGSFCGADPGLISCIRGQRGSSGRAA